MSNIFNVSFVAVLVFLSISAHAKIICVEALDPTEPRYAHDLNEPTTPEGDRACSYGQPTSSDLLEITLGLGVLNGKPSMRISNSHTNNLRNMVYADTAHPFFPLLKANGSNSWKIVMDNRILDFPPTEDSNKSSETKFFEFHQRNRILAADPRYFELRQWQKIYEPLRIANENPMVPVAAGGAFIVKALSISWYESTSRHGLISHLFVFSTLELAQEFIRTHKYFQRAGGRDFVNAFSP